MSIILDEETYTALKRSLGRRLRAQRIACKITVAEAAKAIGHRGMTQVSLAENGERMLPWPYLLKLADLYAVPLDYLFGRIEDPLAEPFENNQGIIARAVAAALQGRFQQFANLMSQQTAIQIMGLQDDRRELKCVRDALREVVVKYARVKELNPEFEDEMRGSSALDSALNMLTECMERIERRHEEELRTYEAMELDPDIDAVGRLRLEQLRLPLRA